MINNPVQMTFRRLIALNWVAATCGGLVMWGMGQLGSQPITAPAAGVERDANGGRTPSSATDPSWGDLEVHDIEIERPPELAAFDISPDAPRWTFEGASREEVRAWFEAANVAPRQIERALSPQMLKVEAEGVVIHPDEELIFSLSPESRAKLYAVLGQWFSNPYMHDPYRTHPGDIERWCTPDIVAPEIAEQVQQLLYRQGDSECFSDYELIVRKLASPADRLNLSRKLSRQRTLMLRLWIEPTTDIDRFLGYWSVRGVRQKDLRPLAEALKRLPEGGSMSVAYVLPPFARQRLYTFPMPDMNAPRKQDCHWTTLNFFNDQPDDRFADGAFVSEYVKNNFYVISAATEYGDRVFFLDGNGNAIHSAVYIASDIVFTKNGAGATQPWVLMHVKDVLDAYGGAERVNMVFYREKSA